MTKGASDLVQEARTRIENLDPEQVATELERGDAILVDLRESEEIRRQGRIAGSVHVPRGILEFAADPDLPHHDPTFRRDRRIILHCSGGGRSALAADTLRAMGFGNVAHMDGGFQAWAESGRPVQET